MKPGMQSLLTMLSAPADADVIASLREEEWRRVIELAEQHRVLAWVAAQALEGERNLPQAILELLLEARREAAIAGFFWTSELAGLLHAFANASIPVIALKGPCFAQRVYGDVSLRSARDLDLLVRREHLTRAETLLRNLNFSSQACADDYHRPWQRGTLDVELHFDVENPLAFHFDIAAAWQRAQPAVFSGQPVWTLAPADELLYLCLHGTRHRFCCLSYVLDIALTLDSFATYNLPHVSPSTSGNLTAALTLGCMLAAKLRPECPSPFASDDAPHLIRLASNLWTELIESNGDSDLDWRAQHRFFLELELSQRHRLYRRLCHTRILATRVIQRDHEFANRFGIRSPWLVWGLRQIRLALKL